jgi:transposase InsO family protein
VFFRCCLFHVAVLPFPSLKNKRPAAVLRHCDEPRPTSPRSPWQNGYAERLIGSIRRECLDDVVVFGERHLRHLLLCYMKYYNGARTHLSLEKDAPVSRAVDRAGHILCRPILGGLHHQYARI